MDRFAGFTDNRNRKWNRSAAAEMGEHALLRLFPCILPDEIEKTCADRLFSGITGDTFERAIHSCQNAGEIVHVHQVRRILK